MKRKTGAVLSVVLLLSFCVPTARAEREVGLKYVSYSDNNKVKVTTGGLDVSVDVTPKTNLTLSGVVDGITAASRKIPLVDGVTGATARTTPDKVEFRKDVAVGITQKIRNHTVSVSGDSSAEDDYSSLSYFLSWMAEFDNRNKAVSLSYSDFSDRLSPFGVTWTDTKLSKVLDFAFSSVLTPHSQMRAVASYGRDDGYLSNPYHRVVVNDYSFKERHPAVRDKAALGLFYTLGFEGRRVSSVQFDYRYYYDNWNVRSHTLGTKYNRYLADGLMGSLRARYYSQGPASFFKDAYVREEEFMSSDPKLGAFSALLYGAGLSYEVISGLTLELMYEQYAQGSNIDHSRLPNSIAQADLVSQIVYVSTRIKL